MELGSIGVEVLMVGALGWPTPTEDMGFWRPVLGELSLAVERHKAVSPNTHILSYRIYYTQLAMQTILLTIALAPANAPCQNANVDTVCQAQ